MAYKTFILLSRGSSPRLRGTGGEGDRQYVQQRFIPAPAGNGSTPPCSPGRFAVHPRACGERSLTLARYFTTTGSSPRLRGTVRQALRAAEQGRFIPAPAGNGDTPPYRETREAVHPRACGERAVLSGGWGGECGSSPRLRGTGLEVVVAQLVARFIPAPAGNGTPPVNPESPFPVHPRACGERVIGEVRWVGRTGSSPRLRGTGDQHLVVLDFRRFIPAPAGNGATTHRRSNENPVHPRACGERTNHYVIDGV